MNMHNRDMMPEKPVELRLAVADDVDALVDLYQTFFAESGYPPVIEFDPERARNYLMNAIEIGFPIIIAPLDNGIIAGAISFEIDHQFSKQPFAVLGEVYGRREFRGTGLGRALVQSAMDLAKVKYHATCFHIPITSGHESVPTLVNLFRKFGAEQIGTIMRKVL
jgi:GNAT superfamily N-acetyltransferase